MRGCAFARRVLCVVLRVASAVVACCIDACCIGARIMLHRCALHVASVTRSPPAALPPCGALHGVLRVGAARFGKGRAFAVAERRRDALVRSRTAAVCSPWTRAPRCSTPWRYLTPMQGCVRGGAALRVSGRCAHGAGVGGRVAGPIAASVGCVGCAQTGGGVVRISDGAVTFKGGTISSSKAVRARPLGLHVLCCTLRKLLLSAACWALVGMPRGLGDTLYTSRLHAAMPYRASAMPCRASAMYSRCSRWHADRRRAPCGAGMLRCRLFV